MKTRLFLPVIMLGISLSAFNKHITIPPTIKSVTIEQATNLPGEDYCSIYAIGSLTKNGQEMGSAYTGYLFYFCSDLTFSVYTDSWVVNGNWMMDEKSGTMLIEIAAPDELNWLKGEWRILDQNDYILEMEHVVNGDVWTVRFERRQR